MHGFRQRLDNTISSIEATAVLHNIHTMMRIEEGDNEESDNEESDDDEARPGGEQTRRRRRVNDIDPGDTSSDDEDNGAPPPRQSKEAIRVEGQALRDSILSGYFSANF